MNRDELTKIEHQISEFKTLENRLNRYLKPLLEKGIEEAKDRGLSARVISEGLHLADADIYIRRDKDSIDVSEIINLAKGRLPALHRKYTKGLERYTELKAELENTLKDLT